MKAAKWIALIVVCLAGLLVAGVMSIPAGSGLAMYPKASSMPPNVDQPMSQILNDLERQIKSKAPALYPALNPGLTEQEIAKLEEQGEFKLPEDLKALYMWHNGCKEALGNELPNAEYHIPVPSHRFLPLEEALELRRQFAEDFSKQAGAAGMAFDALLSYRKGWLPLFQDLAGDGYYYDPDRTYAEGAVFRSMLEDGSYDFFPSGKNLLAWTLKCFEEGHMPEKDDSDARMSDYMRCLELRKQFAAPAPASG